MKNFYDLLTWRDATKNSFPERLFFYPPDEFSGDLKIYISFEEREAHLTQRSVHVGFADNAVPTQILENLLKLVAELWKHAVVSAASFKEWRSPDTHGSLETAAPWHHALFLWRMRCWRYRSCWALLNPKRPVRFDLLSLGFRADKYAA